MNKGCLYVTNSTPRYLGQKVTSDSLEKKIRTRIIFYFDMATNTTTTLNDFEIICKLGDGSFAEVFKVLRK